MNRHTHRLVFNKVRGVLMAVGEGARGVSKGGLRTGVAAALTLGSISVHAQVKADPNAPGNQRPNILQTANGVVQVNIQTPSAAGVSRNTYSQFDVPGKGVVLNNVRSNAAATQLAGYVSANPWLATGAARVILNEVNSANPSLLNGYVEVAGQRAEVVIANPAGIRVNGGGFINAAGVTLTTGTPVMNGGQLESFRVTQGMVNIEGLGLDASTADHARILARAVQVNAGLWAQDLTVVTGSNDVKAQASGVDATAAPIAGTGSAPGYMLDVAAIGGMYAGHIYLKGTEAGLGVNNRGSISATAGNLTLSANGWLDNAGAMQARGQANLALSGALNNSGELRSVASLSVEASGLDNASGAEIASTDATILRTTGILSNQGLIDGANTRIDVGTLTNATTGRIYGSQLALGADTIVNDGVVAARERMDIGARELNNREGALILSAGIAADALTIGGALDAQGRASGSADMLVNGAATIESLGGMSLSARQLINANVGLVTRTAAFTTPEAGAYIVIGGVRYTEDQLGHCFQCATGRIDDGQDGTPRLEFVVPSAQYPFESGYARKPYRVATITWGDFGMESSPYDYPADAAEWALFGVPVGDQTQLRARLTAYNQDFMARATRDFNRIWVTSSQTEQTVIDNPGTPGRLIAAGDLRISDGALHNSDSQILAGGALDIAGSSLTNHETTGYRTVTDYGNFRRDNIEYSPYRLRAGYYGSGAYVAVRESVTTPLGLARVQGQTAVTGTGVEADLGARPQLPADGLWRPVTDPTSHYLVETDPRFTDRNQWLGSDYLLQAMGYDPATVQKRLGDGFYEQKLVREQVARLTGQRFLGDYTQDDAQFRALMDAGTTFARAHQLRPGIALTAEQMAALTSDIVWLVAQEVSLPDGSRTTALVPQVYVVPRAGDLLPSGALLAGRGVSISLDGDLSNAGQIAGRQVVQLNATNVNNLGTITGQTVNVQASQDIRQQGGQIVAEQALNVRAGRDLVIESTTRSASATAGASSSSLTQLDRVAGLYVSNQAGTLIASAGRDLNLVAGVLGSAGSVQASAGQDINLGTISTAQASDLIANARNHLRQSGTQEVGSQISSDSSTTLSAGQDLNARAASVSASGDLSATAVRDIYITEGRTTRQSDDARFAQKSGFMSSRTEASRSQSSSDTAVASQFGGQTVTLRSGANTQVRGSSVIADQGATVVAGGNIDIQAAQQTHNSSSTSQTTKSGLGAMGGISYGKSDQSTDRQTQGTSAAASTVGAISGDVNLIAGQSYRQTGSDVLAPGGDVNIVAQDIKITEARETRITRTEEKFKQSGISVGVSAPVISVAQGLANTAKATGDTQNSRMQALGAATLALQGKQLADGIQNIANASNPAEAANVSVSISLGSSKSESVTETQANTARGSTVQASGDVNVIASGNAQRSDILVQGSELTAGDTARLIAEGVGATADRKGPPVHGIPVRKHQSGREHEQGSSHGGGRRH